MFHSRVLKVALKTPNASYMYVDAPTGLSVDIDALLASGHLQHVSMAAGDIIIFPSAASVHGTIPWKGERARRSVLFGYYSRHAPRRPRM